MEKLKVQFVKTGYETEMLEDVASKLETRGEIKILGKVGDEEPKEIEELPKTPPRRVTNKKE